MLADRHDSNRNIGRLPRRDEANASGSSRVGGIVRHSEANAESRRHCEEP